MKLIRKSFNGRGHRNLATNIAIILLASLFFLFLTTARAVSPPPPGGYPNYTTAVGDDALRDLTTGAYNTAAGSRALEQTTTGTLNTAVGLQALQLNLTGSANTAVGVDALLSCTSSNNTAMGYFALYADTSGSYNTGIGYLSLRTNTTGSFNTATGSLALYGNATGTANTANGYGALISNNIGEDNTADGVNSLQTNTSGNSNTASGVESLRSNSSGSNNIATGLQALFSNTSGHDNTAAGIHALAGNTIGSNNIAVGSSAGFNLTTGNNNIDIGAVGAAAEANTIRIGKTGTQKKTFIAGVHGVTVASGVGVIVGTTGQLGTVVSSARFKDAIKPMEKASEVILKLEPVSFHYKYELDPASIPQFGLVAEQVEKVAPELVAHDGEGKPYTVRYEAVNAMLLNEFLKEHRKAEERGRKQREEEAAIQELESIVARQQKEINAFTTSLRTVSDELERSKVAFELVADNH